MEEIKPILTPSPSCGVLFPSLSEAYISFNAGMMKHENENGLKGQHILAQGKRSDALGWKKDMKIVRAITFIKEKILFRTSEMPSCFKEMMSDSSVRKKLFALFIESSRMVFLLHPLPRLRRELCRTVAFRFVPPETLPWARLFWPFRPGRNTGQNLCIKSSYT